MPSLPVGLEANYINSSALLVKWQLPLFPNGNITKFIVKYESSTYSPWKQDLNWCNRQVFSNRLGVDKTEEGSTDKTPDGKFERSEDQRTNQHLSNIVLQLLFLTHKCKSNERVVMGCKLK